MSFVVKLKTPLTMKGNLVIERDGGIVAESPFTTALDEMIRRTNLHDELVEMLERIFQSPIRHGGLLVSPDLSSEIGSLLEKITR